jgi:hypothetical protein
MADLGRRSKAEKAVRNRPIVARSCRLILSAVEDPAMPRTSPRIRPKSAKAHTRAASKRKPRARNGIPLKRKVTWVYDTSSPEFRVIWKREREALRRSKTDPDIERFIDDALRDIDHSLDRR